MREVASDFPIETREKESDRQPWGFWAGGLTTGGVSRDRPSYWRDFNQLKPICKGQEKSGREPLSQEIEKKQRERKKSFS